MGIVRGPSRYVRSSPPPKIRRARGGAPINPAARRANVSRRVPANDSKPVFFVKLKPRGALAVTGASEGLPVRTPRAGRAFDEKELLSDIIIDRADAFPVALKAREILVTSRRRPQSLFAHLDGHKSPPSITSTTTCLGIDVSANQRLKKPDLTICLACIMRGGVKLSTAYFIRQVPDRQERRVARQRRAAAKPRARPWAGYAGRSDRHEKETAHRHPAGSRARARPFFSPPKTVRLQGFAILVWMAYKQVMRTHTRSKLVLAGRLTSSKFVFNTGIS